MVVGGRHYLKCWTPERGVDAAVVGFDPTRMYGRPPDCKAEDAAAPSEGTEAGADARGEGAALPPADPS